MGTNNSPLDGDIGDEWQKMVDSAEILILGGPRKYTLDEVSMLARIDRGRAERIRRAMGFATVPDDVAAFTDADVEALRWVVGEWHDIAGGDEEAIVAMVRAATQSFSALATWEGELAVDYSLADMSTSGSAAASLLTFSEQVLPLMERTHGYIWRRQIAAYVDRRLALALQQDSNSSGAAVGFADIAGYTALTSRATESEIRRLLDAFESLTTDAVGRNGGRVVKMIGDATLFTTERPTAAAEIALDLRAAWPASEPPLRIGVAAGPVVARFGDIFGSTVNVASRLTSISPPGVVLVDRNMAEALVDLANFRLRQQDPVAVRGFDNLESWTLDGPS